MPTITRSFLFSGLVAAALLVSQFGCKGNMTFNNTEAGSDPCKAGATRCQNGDVEICQADNSGNAWQTSSVCSPGFSTCQMSGGSASCVSDASCTDSKKNQDESDIDCGGVTCSPCAIGKACSSDSDCTSKACSNKICKACKANTTSCYGNMVRTCKPDESGWNTVATCDPTIGHACNVDTKKCEPLTTLGKPSPTGTYYLYSMFNTGTTEFKGGYDVDSYVQAVGDSEVNYLYVNRSMKLDVYKVELQDTDGDGKMEPHQHPNNPDAKGPMEQRKLTFIKTYDNVVLGQPSVGEIYALQDKIYFFKRDNTGGSYTYNIYEFIFKTGVTNMILPGNPKLPLCVLGYDKGNKQWFAGYNSSIRRVYGHYPTGGGWAAEFDYPNLAGSHMDGLEVVVDPKKKKTYVYVSDMTSDFLAQYSRDDKTGKWVQNNVFEYAETGSNAVEGMGFGAFQHFWATSGKAVYEVGGGDLQKYVGPQIE